MRPAVFFLVATLTASIPAFAQGSSKDAKMSSDGIMSTKAAVFASVGQITYAVHNAGEFELGFYYESADADVVNFHECPNGQPVMKLHRSEVTDSGKVNCGSEPGTPKDPFSHQMVGEKQQWIYNIAKNGFNVEDFASGISGFVPCEETPAAMIDAAQLSGGAKFGLTGGDAKTLHLAAADLGGTFQQLIPGKAKVTDCSLVDQFWTVGIGKYGSQDVFAVSKKQPFKTNR